MKKNKKGFTLIELLAVIVILGIILTIVVSNVVKYIKQAREGSYKDAIVVFLKNTQTSIMGNQIDNNNSSIVVCDDDATSSKPTTYVDATGVSKQITNKCSEETDIYDYDKNNMKIRIVPEGANYHVKITGINSFQNITPKSIDKVTTTSGSEIAEFTIDSNAQLQ